MPGLPQNAAPKGPNRLANPGYALVVERLRRGGMDDAQIAAVLATMPPVPLGGAAAGPVASPVQSPVRRGFGGVMTAAEGGLPMRPPESFPRTSAAPPTGTLPSATQPLSPLPTATTVAPPPVMAMQNSPGGVGFGAGDQAGMLEAFATSGGFNAVGRDVLAPAASPAAAPAPAPAMAPAAAQPAAPGGIGGFLDRIKNPDIGRSVLDFGLATLAAGGQPGASFGGAVGQGGLTALQGRDRRKLAEALTKRQDRSDARDEERLGLERRRIDEKTPARVVNVRTSDGKLRSFRLDDPRLDRALNAGGVEAGNDAGGLSLAQERANYEVDAARQILESQNLSRAEIARRTAKATSTGRENPDYDPTLDDLVRQAARRKTGDDPEFNRVYRRLYGEPPPPIPEPEGQGNLDAMDRGPGPAAAARIETMGPDELDAYVGAAGDRLSPADLRRIERRLQQLGL
jgi:hypothetical protein